MYLLRVWAVARGAEKKPPVQLLEQLMRAVHVAPVIEDEERRALAREKIDVMVANAQKDRCMPTNPVTATPEQIAELYRAIC